MYCIKAHGDTPYISKQYDSASHSNSVMYERIMKKHRKQKPDNVYRTHISELNVHRI